DVVILRAIQPVPRFCPPWIWPRRGNTINLGFEPAGELDAGGLRRAPDVGGGHGTATQLPNDLLPRRRVRLHLTEVHRVERRAPRTKRLVGAADTVLLEQLFVLRGSARILSGHRRARQPQHRRRNSGGAPDCARWRNVTPFSNTHHPAPEIGRRRGRSYCRLRT